MLKVAKEIVLLKITLLFDFLVTQKVKHKNSEVKVNNNYLTA